MNICNPSKSKWHLQSGRYPELDGVLFTSRLKLNRTDEPSLYIELNVCDTI